MTPVTTRHGSLCIKLNSPLINKIAGMSLWAAVHSWMRPLDYKILYYDAAVDPAHRSCDRRGIYIFWHEYMQFLLYLRGQCNLAMLISRHRDADVMESLARHFGYSFGRGSTARGGKTAVRQMMRHGRRCHLTITPDGPRGPRRQLASGCIYLASRLGIPLVPIGCGYDRPWRAPSWDQFAVPRPFSRARLVTGPYLEIPSGLDREGIEYYRARIGFWTKRNTGRENLAYYNCFFQKTNISGNRLTKIQSVESRYFRRRRHEGRHH